MKKELHAKIHTDDGELICKITGGKGQEIGHIDAMLFASILIDYLLDDGKTHVEEILETFIKMSKPFREVAISYQAETIEAREKREQRREV